MKDSAVDSRTKGLPHTTAALRLSEIGAKRWNVLKEDLPLPLALLRESALTNNRRWMRGFLAKTGAKLAPHGKTHMSPELLELQLADGAWAITLATAQQVRVARLAGVDRILLANQMVGPRDIEYILDELRAHPSFEFYCLVDSLEGIARLATAARSRSPGRPLQLLIEMGYQGGRAGCRDVASALAIARAIAAETPHLILRGVEGFEGLLGSLPGSEGVPKVMQFLEKMVEASQCIDEENLFGAGEIILTAGGSAYYDLAVAAFSRAQLRRKAAIVLRSGCYFTHDAGTYERHFSDVLERSSQAREVGSRFENALELWAYVVSVPESGRAILGAGRRDFGNDSRAPIPLKHFRPGRGASPSPIRAGHEIVAVNDQHAHMTFPPAADIQVGDMIALGVSHPCTTLDKWQLLHVVDDQYNVVSALRTFF